MNEALAGCLKSDEGLKSGQEAARSAIIRTLRASGLDLVSQGLTTVEEVFRTTIES